MKFYQVPEKEIITQLHSDATQGLTTKEARNRLQIYGYNTLESLEKYSF